MAKAPRSVSGVTQGNNWLDSKGRGAEEGSACGGQCA